MHRRSDIFDVSVGHYCQCPAVVVDGRGWVWTAVVANFAQRRFDGQPVRHLNALWVKCRGPGRPDPEMLSEPGTVVWAPVLAAVGDQVWAIWMAWCEGRWDIVARPWRGGTWGEPLWLTSGPGHNLHPAVAADDDGLWIAWQHMADGAQQIWLGRLEGGDWSGGRCISVGLPDSHRPSIALTPSGQLWAAWDVYAGGRYHVVAGPVGRDSAAVEVVSTDGVFNGQASMAAGPDGSVWLAWYHRRQLAGPRREHRILLRRHRAGRWEMPEGIDGLEGGELCERGDFRPALAPMADGSMAVAWTQHGTWLRADTGLRWIGEGAYSHIVGLQPNQQSFARAGAKYWFIRDAALAADADGRAVWVAYLYWQATQAPSLVHVRRVAQPPLLHPLGWRSAPARSVDEIADQRGEGTHSAPHPGRGKERPYRAAFLDLHGHCEYSFDAFGTADQWFNFARDRAALDGVALTDHDVTPGEHYLIVAHANHYNREGEFVALAGTEIVFGRPAGGEKQVIYFSDEPPLVMSLFHVGEGFIDRDLARRLIARAAAVVITHDGSFLPGCVDIDNQDLRCELAAQITSTHTGALLEDFERYVEGSRRPPHWPRVQDALRRGFVYAFVGGSDSHDSRPEGRTAVLVEGLSRKAVRDALMARRCYATTGPRIWLWVELAGRPMGSLVPAADAFARGRVQVEIDGGEAIEAVALVFSGGEERVELGGVERWAGEVEMPPVTAEPGENWLYVRVEFRSGARAWSSPLWVVDVE